MIKWFKKIWDRRPWKRVVPPLSTQTARALRQLHSRYQKQKRMWLYAILSSGTLICIYGIFAVFLESLWEILIPVGCIVVAGVGISIIQVRRCNDVIRMIRQAYNVQIQIDKVYAEAEQKKQEEEAQASEQSASDANGTSRPQSDPPEE